MAVDTQTTFSVVPRELVGKKVKQLRRESKIPANIMGLSKDSQSVVVDRIKFEKLYNEEGDTGLIYLEVEGSKKKVPVLIEDVQREPKNGNASHAVFKRVNLNVKVKAEVSVEIEGENTIPDTTLLLVRDSIEVEALPADLPEGFTIFADKLTEVGQVVTLADLEYDREKVTLVLGEEEDETAPVAILQEFKEQAEPEEGPTETEITTAAEGEAPAEEGEATAE